VAAVRLPGLSSATALFLVSTLICDGRILPLGERANRCCGALAGGSA